MLSPLDPCKLIPVFLCIVRGEITTETHGAR